MPEKSSTLWSSIKDIPKDKRKEFRAQNQEKLPKQSAIRQKLVMGINKVTENLENNNIDCVMLTSDIQPFYMAQHILDLCIVGSVPVLIIEDLRKELNNTLGIASTCLGIIINHKHEILADLCKAVRNGWENNPPPDDHSLNIKQDSCIIADDKEFNVLKKAQNTTKDKVEKKVENCRDLHLVRTDTKSRVYVPQRIKRNNLFNADFIRFSGQQAEVSKSLIGMQVGKMIKDKWRVKNEKRQKRNLAKGQKPKTQFNRFKPVLHQQNQPKKKKNK